MIVQKTSLSEQGRRQGRFASCRSVKEVKGCGCPTRLFLRVLLLADFAAYVLSAEQCSIAGVRVVCVAITVPRNESDRELARKRDAKSAILRAI